MTTYAIINSKGGVGKTTVAVHLATHLAHSQPTLLIDGDPQASAASWAAWRRESNRTVSPSTASLVGKAILEEGRPLGDKFAHTVVDAGGRDSAGLRAALLLAQHAIVPVIASQLDAAALTDVLAIIDMAKDFNPTLAVWVLLNRIDARTKDTADMLDYLESKELSVLNSRLTERVAYRRAVGEGLTVNEYGKDHTASREIMMLFAEVVQ